MSETDHPKSVAGPWTSRVHSLLPDGPFLGTGGTGATYAELKIHRGTSLNKKPSAEGQRNRNRNNHLNQQQREQTRLGWAERRRLKQAVNRRD